MKCTLWIALGVALLTGANGALAQSLGDVARSNRQAKSQQPSSSRQFDNENLPTTNPISVVGKPAEVPAPQKEQTSPDSSSEEGKTASAAAKPGAEAKTASVDWKKKLDEQKKKVDDMAKELDINQREYRLRAAAFYSDAGNRLRNSAQWDKEDTQYKQTITAQQKALDTAKQELSEMEEQARKAQ